MHSKNTAIYRIHFPLPIGSGKGSAPRWNRTNNPVIKSYKDDYAEAKTAYFKALRDEVPELAKIATGKEARPPELEQFAAAFAVAGERQEMAADQETLVLLKRFSRNPRVEKARGGNRACSKSRREIP